MVIAQGDVRWADLSDPVGSGPGFRRPVVVQGDVLNRSRLATTICVPLTSNLQWAAAPGNVLLSAEITGLPRDSFANMSQVFAVDRSFLDEWTGRLTKAQVNCSLAWTSLLADSGKRPAAVQVEAEATAALPMDWSLSMSMKLLGARCRDANFRSSAMVCWSYG